jgi:hypothetical protein
MVDKKLLFSLIVLFSLFVIASLFVYMKPEITGFAVIESYITEADCVGAGYTWENLTEENCTVVTICINETIEQCECSEYEIINETTNETECVNWSSCINEICDEEEDCTIVVTGGQCVGDICDSEHLSLCNESECDNLNYYWYNGVCNSEEQCILDCSEKECGDDGCGGSCGDCNSGYECEDGDCVEEEANEENETDETEETETISESESFFTGATVETTEEICSPDWSCTEWSECINETQSRTCEDINSCGSEEGKPAILQSCVLPETCFDGIKNQNETGVDCGGVCEKKCSFFTIVGSVINIPVQTGKQFFAENKTRSFIIVGILVLITGGFVTIRVLKKKNLLVKILPKKFIPEKN